MKPLPSPTPLAPDPARSLPVLSLPQTLSLSLPLSLSLLLALAAAPVAGADAVPAAFSAGPALTQGWAHTRGGRGGQVLRVTHLGADGPGSLKAALDAQGPRIVVFEVGGVIDMGGQPLDIRHPYITVAGQTAPSPGISIIKAETTIRTHDVIVQHLRFRPGEFGRPKKGGGDQDGLSTLGGAHDVIVDHCSFSWATDENLSASGPRFEGPAPDDWRRHTSHRITFSHNLIVEGLSNSVHVKGEHSKGSLIHDNTQGVLLYGNVYLSNRERNALFKGGAQGAMVNNLIVNPGRRAVHYNLLAKEWGDHAPQTGRLSLVGNVLRHGPDTRPGTALFTLRGQGDVELHLHDNLAFDRLGAPVPMTEDQSADQAHILPLATAQLPPGLTVWPAQSVEAGLAATAGARPWDRYSLDQHAWRDIASGQGRIIDAETENPLGYPQHTPTRRPFVPDAWNLEDMSPRQGWPRPMRTPSPPAALEATRSTDGSKR
jgi:hypothetical protein